MGAPGVCLQTIALVEVILDVVERVRTLSEH